MIKKCATVFLIILISLSCKESEVETSNCFEVKTPEEVGLSQEFIDQITNEAQALPNIYSLIILKDNALITEKYMNGARYESLLHMRSITKSVSSLLIGIAIDQGIVDVDEKVISYYDEYIDDNRSDQLDEIKLDHLLDMKSGFDWDESEEAIPWYSSITDSWTYMLKKQVIDTPGTKFNYNSGSISLLTRFIESNYDGNYRSYAETNIFEPLEISHLNWEQDGIGNYRADAGLQLRAIDIAKIGYLLLNKGTIDSKSIVNEEWIDSSWEFETALEGSLGSIQNIHYNNLWWMGEYQSKQIFFGWGYGGQLLLIVPELELVVVANHNYLSDPDVVNTQSSNFITTIFKPLMDKLIN